MQKSLGESLHSFLFPSNAESGKGWANAGRTGLDYKVVPIDTGEGEQHAPDFRAINPNGKVPAIVDPEGPASEEVRVFDSSAILLYLGEKTGRFLGSPVKRPELLSDDADPLAAFLDVEALVSNRRPRAGGTTTRAEPGRRGRSGRRHREACGAEPSGVAQSYAQDDAKRASHMLAVGRIESKTCACVKGVAPPSLAQGRRRWGRGSAIDRREDGASGA
jgi:hypothetical protein